MDLLGALRAARAVSGLARDMVRHPAPWETDAEAFFVHFGVPFESYQEVLAHLSEEQMHLLEATIEVSAPGATPRIVSRKVFVAPDQAWDGSDFGRLASLLTADVGSLAREVLAGIPPKG